MIAFNKNRIEFNFEQLFSEIENLVIRIISIEDKYKDDAQTYIEKCKELFFSILEKPIQTKTFYSLPKEINEFFSSIGLYREKQM
ncbi:hypothetical protein Mh1962_17620 [Mannheimia haemolytica]